jgi:hypothetical protein
MEDIARTITFVTEDRDWLQKLVKGAAFTLLSVPLIVGLPVVFGYMLELHRRVVRGAEPVLPEWDNLPGKFVEGLKFLGVALAYLVIFGILGWCLTRVPLVRWVLAGVVGIVFMMAFLYVMTRFALTGELREAFDVPGIYEALKNNFVEYLVASFLWLVYMVVACLGVLACGVGVFFTLFWAWLAVSYAASKAYVGTEQPEDTVAL